MRSSRVNLINSKKRMNLIEFAQRMPKAELHVHLEGSIQPKTLLKIAQRNKIDLPAKDEAGLQDFYRFQNFDHFIQVYSLITSCLKTPEDYRLIAYEFGAECARQNIRYAEVTFTFDTNIRLSGLTWETILESLNAGQQQAHDEFGVFWNWIFDIGRNNPGVQEAQILQIALQSRQQGCVALGLGGSEADYPGELFTDVFNQAFEAKLASIPHAGETGGAESVWQSLTDLHAVRIGHGVRAIEDPTLVQYLVEHRIPLEICPTSNIRLGIYPDYASHPLRQLWDAGVMVTVNSDDPPMFGTDLNHEYQALIEQFGFQANDLEKISLNAVEASLLAPAVKKRMIVEFQNQFTSLRKELS